MAEKTIYFEGAETINDLCVGAVTANLRAVAKHFEVTIVSREHWVKVSGPSLSRINKAVAFFQELSQVHESNFPLHQRDFDLILAAGVGRLGHSASELYAERIKVSPRKADIVPRTDTQYRYIKSIREKDIVMGVGPAGTGKTYLAMAMAISGFLNGDHNRVVLTRPAMEAGEKLGFLPGTLEEKIKPYLRPLYDALYDMLSFDEANKLIENNIIEVAPLAFMRGRTLNNAFIILDEAQNTTSSQMLMFLTRIGFDSKCVITGDPSQTDLPPGKPSGLSRAIEILKQVPEIAVCRFHSRDVVRNPLIGKIVKAYAKFNRNRADDEADSASDDEKA